MGLIREYRQFEDLDAASGFWKTRRRGKARSSLKIMQEPKWIGEDTGNVVFVLLIFKGYTELDPLA